jgi:hypothetical protein
MKKLLAIALFLFAVTTASTLHAQSLTNSNWKCFFPQLGDTLTLHFRTDSSFVTNTVGDVVVRSLWKLSGDTVTLNDYDGQYACLNLPGRYLLVLADGILVFKLVEDNCEGRPGSLSEAKWTKVP